MFQIAVVGPVEYRKGVLLLKCNNVHFLGGEVEHLLIKNAPLNVLCKVLLVFNLIHCNILFIDLHFGNILQK